ncbi:transposase, partial [Klebsiella pneumoniae]|nr:transposase [Klebsiella pneumoniae]
LLSSKHSKAEMITTKKKKIRNYNDQNGNITKPNIVLDYDDGMGGVDLQDSYLSSFPLMRKFAKSYRKIFFYLMDMEFLIPLFYSVK